MTRIVTGWDEAARQGAGIMKMGPQPTLTERSDLGSINKDTKAGWGRATPGTKRRVREKMGKGRG